MMTRLEQLNPLVKLSIGSFIVLALLVLGLRFGSVVSLGGGKGTLSVSDAEQCLRKGGNIYFNVTFGNEEYLKRYGEWETAELRQRSSQAFIVSANAHVGTISDISLDGKIFLVNDGVKYPAAGGVLESTTHHNTYLVFFPRQDMEGKAIFEKETGSFDILIKDIEFPDRVFTFRHPLPGAGPPVFDFKRLMMLGGSVMAALLVACTPCLVGSLSVGSMATGTAGSLAGGDKDAVATARKRIVKGAVLNISALVVTYLLVALVIGAFKWDAEDLRPVEFVGGVILLVIGLSFLRGWGPVARLERAVRRLVAGIHPALARYAREGDDALSSPGSSAMGASLALVCSVAGAPTLSTAIILPVMVYAGITDIYWALVLLLAYLLVVALPFFLIAVGLGEWLLNASIQWRHRLLVANGFLLLGLGVLLFFSPTALAGALSVPARLVVKPFMLIFQLVGLTSGS